MSMSMSMSMSIAIMERINKLVTRGVYTYPEPSCGECHRDLDKESENKRAIRKT